MRALELRHPWGTANLRLVEQPLESLPLPQQLQRLLSLEHSRGLARREHGQRSTEPFDVFVG